MEDFENLHIDILEQVVAREGLRPLAVTTMQSSETGQVVGELTEYVGFNVDKVVEFKLHIDEGDDDVTDLRWLHVFSPSSSLVPHLALEWKATGGVDARRVHLVADLLPRIDLAVNLDYVDEVYQPLSSLHERVADIAGIKFAYLPPRRMVAMSPWRLAISVPADQARELQPMAQGYYDRWVLTISGGVAANVDPLARDQARLVQHDRFHRNTLFDAGSDPGWARIDRCVGIDAGAIVRTTLRSQRER